MGSLPKHTTKASPVIPGRLGVLLLLLLACSAEMVAQSSAIDSIRRVIATAKVDTTRLAAMIALSEHIYTVDPDTNLIICRDALHRANAALKKSGLKPEERSALLRIQATAVNNMAVSHFIFGELDSALNCFQRAQGLHEANGNLAGAADALNNQGIVYEAQGNHAEQRRCLFSALHAYERAKDQANTGTALNNIGNYFAARGRPDSALAYLDSSLKVFTGLEDQQGIANSLLNIGRFFEETGKPAEALERYLECERIYTEQGDDRSLAVCYNNIASIYKDQGILEESIGYLHRALDIHLEQGDKLGEATVRMNIGTALDDQGELDMALEEFDKSLAIYRGSGDRTGEALIHGHIGNVWKNKGDRPKALEHLHASLAISRGIDSPDEISTALYKLGHYHEDVGEFDSALAHYEECLAVEQRTLDKESEAFTLYSIGGLKLKQGKAAEAERYAELSLAIAQELGYPVNIMRATQVLNEALAKQGKWARALEMLELHQQMKDSVDNAENAKKTVRLQMRYTFDKKQLADSLAHAAKLGELENEKRIATLESEQARNRSWAYGLGGLLLLGGGGAVYRLDRKRRQERFEREAAVLEVKALRARMNPHFIFNALNSINEFVEENERTLAKDYLSRFAGLMNSVLENSQRAEVPLANDLKALRTYMDLEQLRMSGKFDYTITVDPSIDQYTTLVPPLVLQPFVENAIWHGISPKEGKGHITLSVQRQDTRLMMTVEDDGVGRKPSAAQSPSAGTAKTSLGTAITRERLDMFGKQRQGHAGFRYTDLLHGTRVEVEMPIATV